MSQEKGVLVKRVSFLKQQDNSIAAEQQRHDDSPPQQSSADEEIKPKHWVVALLQKHSLLLDNRGSVARDHLANERTYLAWTRTALVMMTLGLGFVQLYSIQIRAHEAVYGGNTYPMDTSHGVESLRIVGKPFGVLIGVFALVTMMFGFYRYVLVQSGLRHGEFPATRFLASGVLLMSVVSMVLILVMDIKSL